MNKLKVIGLIMAIVMAISLAACTVVEPQDNTGTQAPTGTSTVAPTGTSTEAPTGTSTVAPTDAPTAAPTEAPTGTSTGAPTDVPTAAPTEGPTDAATEPPTEPPVDTYVAPENYEEYIAMSGEDQMRFINSFPSVDAFLEWVTAAREEYEASSNKTPVGSDGIIDVGGN